jgi:predicted secreted hydrolase
MKNRLVSALFVITMAASAEDWQLALPGYRYEFPRDHFSHPEYQTEWWYYTGNLLSHDGRRFGFELTFFREGVDLSKQDIKASEAEWRPDQIYLAHLALSNIDGGHFYHTERLNRAGPGLAGVSLPQQRYWNGNWQVRWLSPAGEQDLQAVCERFSLRLHLRPEKPTVIQGKDGVSQRGPERGQASHYISFTRLRAEGNLDLNGSTFALTGIAWMDHEFFSEQRNSTVAGWDWFAIQLDNNEELMLYRLRNKSGVPSPYSFGTYIDREGRSRFLDASQFQLSPGGIWKSSASGARYPLAWTIKVPSLDLQLSERTALKDQELFTKGSVSPAYWEGAVTYHGQMRSQPAGGVGYLEMTGYAEPLQLGQR